MQLILCLALVVVSLVAFCWVYSMRDTPRKKASFSPCGCVFDIDDTITCGSPEKAVSLCRERGCAIGINTARPVPWADDVNLTQMGFPVNVVNLEDFVYNSSGTDIVKHKVEGLKKFQQKWNISSPKDVLFFDDNLANLEGATSAGFSTVRCSTGGLCGITEMQIKEANQFFLSRSSSRL